MIKFPSWLDLSVIKSIEAAIKPFGETRLVGGVVREILRGNVAKDIDLATTATPEQVIEALKHGHIKCVETGLKHGTVTAILKGHPFEITTLRKDVETTGRHASVEYTSSWEEDSNRRDFTVNAMYLDTSGNLFDFHNGQEDLKNSLVRFVGDASTRIEEDYLRILRFFRFFGYLPNAKYLDNELEAIQKRLHGLDKLSGERIYNEMHKIFGTHNAKNTLMLMSESNVFDHIGLKKVTPDFHAYEFSNYYLVNWAATLIASNFYPDDLKKIKNWWKFSNKEFQALEELCFGEGRHIAKKPIRAQKEYIYFKGLEAYNLAASLEAVMNPDSHFEPLQNWNPAKFKAPQELIQNTPEKERGKLFKELERKWIDECF